MKLESYARFHYEHRWLIAAGALAFCLFLIPQARGLRIENNQEAWFAEGDPHWKLYRDSREEFGGSQTLILVVSSSDLFSRPVLSYLLRISNALENLPHVERVYSLATANSVRATEEGLEVRPYLDGASLEDPAELRRRVLGDPVLRGDLVSEDGTLAGITVSFHESVDAVQGRVLTEARRMAESGRPEGVELHFNGSLRISAEYERQTIRNLVTFTPPMFVLIVATVYFLFRSWGRVVVVLFTTGLAVGTTIGWIGLLGFSFNILSTMVVPLVAILAIADDIHLLQHFDRSYAVSESPQTAFEGAVSGQLKPILGATLTTSLGMASLATSQVAAVREFGIVTAIGVALDLVISFAFLPLALTLVAPRRRSSPAGERLSRRLARAADRLSRHSRSLLLGAFVLVLVSIGGILRLRTSTDHITFFPEDGALQSSAKLIDERLSGVYSFEVILGGGPGTFKDAGLLRRIDELARRIDELPFTKRTLSVLNPLERVHHELTGESGIPSTDAAVAQELFLFGLNEEGRRDLRSFLSSDFSRLRIWVKIRSAPSEEIHAQIREVERIAGQAFADTALRVDVTGAGRLFTALHEYLVVGQLWSFGTAFLTVFGVIFLVFRSFRYGVLAIPANLVPVLMVLGIMGWLGITLNMATVMVASVALGVIDDDTVHFIVEFRRGLAGGASVDQALTGAITTAGGAALLTAVVNCVAFGVVATSAYKPAAYWGYLMSLTMILAFASEVVLLPACIRVGSGMLRERS